MSEKKEIKITKEEAEQMENLGFLYRSPAARLGALQEPDEVHKRYRELWDSLGLKYGFDPHLYSYINGKGRFVKKE